MEQKKEEPPADYTRIIAFAFLIAALDIVLLLVIGFWNAALAIASVSIISFFGTLSLADYAKKQLGYEKGELRTAITATIIVTYLVIVAQITFSTNSIDTDLAETVIINFGYVVWIVLGFYFGTKIFEILPGIPKALEQEKEIEVLRKKMEELEK
jgi:predicted neutral ceramidase superfamily lipid hydrolase